MLQPNPCQSFPPFDCIKLSCFRLRFNCRTHKVILQLSTKGNVTRYMQGLSHEELIKGARLLLV